MSFDTSESDFLSEIKKQFDRDMYLRENLDKKANSMTYLSTGVFVILAIIAVMIQINSNVYMLGILTTSIILAIASISFFILASSIRPFHFPYGHNIFFYKNALEKNSDMIDNSVLDKFKNATKKQFTEHQINQYLKSMRDNVSELESKAFYMQIGVPLLILSLVGLAIYGIAIIIYQVSS